MSLLHNIRKNSRLRILEAGSTLSHTAESLCGILPPPLQHSHLAFLYVSNDLKSLSAYFSMLQSEAALVLLSAELHPDLKKNLETLYRPDVIFDSKTRESGISGAAIHLATSAGNLFFRCLQSSHTIIHPKVKVLLSTSGTTGSPKFVKLSEDNLLANAISITQYLPIKPQDVCPLNLPIHYSYGLSVLHSNALKGGTIVCGLPDILQPEFWEYFSALQINSLAGVPFFYEMLLRTGLLERELPSLSYLTQAGGNLPMGLKTRLLTYCRKQNIALFVMYGQTEATARIAYVPPDKLEEKLASIGIPIPGGRLWLDETSGELLYSGPNIFGGYAQKREDLAHWESIPILQTGDIAERDEDGYFYIRGRLKRIVKIAGNRINLDEIERFLKEQFPNHIFGCSGWEDTNLVISYNGSTLDPTVTGKMILERYKLHPSVLRYQQQDHMPLTDIRKINYTALTENYKKSL